MTGPEHYRMAESLLTGAATSSVPDLIVATAQAHATLALAAATAYPPMRDYYGDELRDGSAWARVTGS